MSIVERAAKGHGKSMSWLCEDNKAELYALCRALLDEEQAVKMTVAVMNDSYTQAAAQNITDEAAYTRWLLTEAATRCGAQVLGGEAPQTVSTVPRAKFARAEAVYNGDMAEGEQALSEMLAPLDSYRRFAYVLAMCGLSYAEIGTAMNQREAIARYCVETAAYTVARGKTGALRTDQVPSFLKKRAMPSEVNKECAAYIVANTKRQTPLWKILTPVAGALAVVAVVLVILLSPKGTLTHTTGSNNNTNGSGNNSNNSGASSAVTVDVNKTYYADITIKDHGTIKVKLEPKDAPITVSNFVDLANEGFYDGLTLHRIMEGFMMQGGDPLGNGKGGSETNIVGEFTSNGYNNKLKHTRGAISMARAYDPNSASSQFFIMHKTSEHLDGDYAVFGYVTEGMDIVDTICESAQPIDNNGAIPAEEQPVIQSIKIRTE